MFSFGSLLSLALSVFCLGFAVSAGAADVLGPDDFEVGFGNWTNITGDQFDWTRDSGGTPSSGTGPSVDHTLGTAAGYYLFIETSSPRVAGDTAILESPCIDLTGVSEAELSLWYHMYGASIGTLDVQVASSTGDSCGALGSYASAWSLSGDQGNTWYEANVDLDGYVGGSIQIHILGIRGSSYTGDIAIDDVLVTATSAIPCTENWECDDSDPCTDDVCGVGDLCEYSFNTDPCDDGVACTGSDVCSAGVCAGTDSCPGDQSCDLGAGVCVEDVLTIDADTDALIQVNPVTGDRTVVSASGTRGSGPGFLFTRGVITESDGQILVCEGDLTDTNNRPSILRVDPTTGDRTIISGCVDVACASQVGTGPAFDTLFDIILDDNGDILVADTEIDTLFRVDAVTGDRTVLSSNTRRNRTGHELPGRHGARVRRQHRDDRGNQRPGAAGRPGERQSDGGLRCHDGHGPDLDQSGRHPRRAGRQHRHL